MKNYYDNRLVLERLLDLLMKLGLKLYVTRSYDRTVMLSGIRVDNYMERMLENCKVKNNER